jgi:hypothetical protein
VKEATDEGGGPAGVVVGLLPINEKPWLLPDDFSGVEGAGLPCGLESGTMNLCAMLDVIDALVPRGAQKNVGRREAGTQVSCAEAWLNQVVHEIRHARASLSFAITWQLSLVVLTKSLYASCLGV